MKEKDLIYLERDIVSGMIVSTKYLKQAIELVDLDWVQAKEAKLLMQWCFDYFKKHQAAPGQNIEKIYINKISGMQKATAELIEQILEDLSDSFEDKEEFNVSYQIEQTIRYCTACKLSGVSEQVQDMVEADDLDEAQSLLSAFKPVEVTKSVAVLPLGSATQIKTAFASQGDSLIRYPGVLGGMVNTAMVKEGFVVFLAQNKGGKSFHLMKSVLLGADQGQKVAFFQAGDMSQAQQERRMAISIARRSDLPQYTRALHIPTLDCIKNQNGTCEQDCQEAGDTEHPLDHAEEWFHNEIKQKDLIESIDLYPDHQPCYECLRHNHLQHHFKGTLWYRIKPACKPLTWKMSYHLFKKNKKLQKKFQNIRLITYSSDMLTMSKIYMELELLKKSGFTADIVVIDYLDLCAPDNDVKTMKPRDQENSKWKRARQLSQELKILLISASQSDADGFNKRLLNKSNFSEDRRKLDHVTAMFGLNMANREKKIGIMRVNDIVSRDTEGANVVQVMHRLQIGQPILGSYY